MATCVNRWWTVAAGAVGCSLGAGVLVIYTFGVFASAMASDFGWSRAVHANALSIFLLCSGTGSLLLGPLIDRYGVRLPCAVLVGVFGLSVASLSFVPANPSIVYALFAVIGLSGSAATAMPYAVAVRGLFDDRRGIALGLVNFGSGMGSAIAPYGAGALLSSSGWRGGFLSVGLAALVPVLGLLVLVRDPAHSPGARRLNFGRGVWVAQLRRRSFWMIAIPIAGISLATFGVLGTMVPLLKDRGMAAESIALIMSSVGLSTWVARPLAGYALDRFFAPFVSAVTFASAVAGLLLVVLTHSMAGTLIAGVLIGFALGSEGDLVTFLVSRYFGPEVYSRVLGAIWVTWAWGGGIGTFAAGTSFRLFTSYTPALLAFAALLSLCIIIVSRLGPYDYPAVVDSAPQLVSARASQ
jgi:MFS family permease